MGHIKARDHSHKKPIWGWEIDQGTTRITFTDLKVQYGWKCQLWWPYTFWLIGRKNWCIYLLQLSTMRFLYWRWSNDHIFTITVVVWADGWWFGTQFCKPEVTGSIPQSILDLKILLLFYETGAWAYSVSSALSSPLAPWWSWDDWLAQREMVVGYNPKLNICRCMIYSLPMLVILFDLEQKLHTHQLILKI